MVHVGWFRPLVTKLLPSTINRFGTSCARWYLSTTELLGSFPIRQVPMRCPAAVVSSMGNAHFLPAPAASSNSSDRSRKKPSVLKSSGWLLYVTRNPGSPQASFASGSRLIVLDSSGRHVVWLKTVRVRLKFSLSAGIDSAATEATTLRIGGIELLDHAGP